MSCSHLGRSTKGPDGIPASCMHPAHDDMMMIRCCCSRLVLVDLERKIRCLQKKRDMRRTPCQTVECQTYPRSERRRMLPFVSTGGVATPRRVAGRATLHAVAAARTVAARGRCLFISRPPGNKRMAKTDAKTVRDREMRA